jgi:signal peptidase I
VKGQYGLVIRLLGLWLRRELLVVDVQGASMEPALKPGDRLLCSRGRTPSKGTIVIRASRFIRSPPYYQIKRVLALEGEVRDGKILSPGYCWIEGDNKDASGDSRHFGPVHGTELIAVAIARLRGNRLDDLTPERGPVD